MSAYAPRCLGDVKARVGADAVFEWVCPGPLYTDAGPPDVGPSLTVHLPSGDVSVALTTVARDTVTAIGDGRRSLTLVGTGFAGGDGWLARNGEAWLLTATQAVPVRCVDNSGGPSSVVTLAEPLPRSVTIDASARLQLSRAEGVLPAGTICAATLRNIRWTVDYSVRHGTGTDLALMVQRETGLLQVVHQPFATGAAPQDVARYLRSIGASPSGEQGWESALAAGEEALIIWLRAQLAERGLTEDDYPAPQGLRLAHILIAGSYAVTVGDSTLSADLRAQGFALASELLRGTVWLDADRDGEADESPVQVGGSRTRDFRAPDRSTYVRRFTIGGCH